MADKVKGAERVDSMVEGLRKWQAIERKSIEISAEAIEKTSNPYLRVLMEVVRHDSLMHHRIQQTIIDSLTREGLSLTPNEVGEIWKSIEKHDEAEKEVIELAKSLREQAWTPIHKQLLDYLLVDEEKHDRIFEQLEQLKKGMYPYAG